jgi:diguanylate cyclase (GGDEF)-like protein
VDPRPASPGRAEADLAAALGGVSEGVAVWDTTGRLVIGNRRLEEIFGLRPGSAAPGLFLGDFLAMATAAGRLDQDDPAEARATLEAVLARREALTWDMQTADGRAIRVLVRPAPGGGWIGSYDDMTDRLRAEAKAAYMARHDPLTQLANRPYFRERLSDALARGGQAAILFVDLDRFKEINDSLGHTTGDALLRAVAQRLSGCFRHGDTVARLGGDEFAAALTRGEGRAEAEAVARRVVEALSRPFALDIGEVTVGASIGIALAPSDGSDPEALVRAADLALYAAKSEGRGTHRLYDAAMGQALHRRRSLEADLRQAIEQEALELHYQPIVSARTGQVSVMEALMRWNHPERGQVPPSAFIPIAEATRLVLQLGAWALRRACADAAAWPERVKVAVNLSPAQFVANDILGDVRRALSESGLAHGRLELEVTESMLVRDADRTRLLFHDLRATGVRIAMDDFGTGYSSLSQLRDFPFDKVKVDRAFVADLGTGRRGAEAIVRAVTGIAGALGMETVAEGVETREQLRGVVAAGCDHAQGWLFGRAAPLADATRLLNAIEAKTRQVAATPVTSRG